MHSNPFATRFTRPGAIPFLFPSEQSPATVVEALRQARWRGQIIGPHGSGKSTLLAALMPELNRQGREVVSIVLRSNGPTPGSWPPDFGSWTPQTQVVVDGYEQLSWWNRQKLKRAIRRAGAGLLVTTHRSCGLPTVFETSPNQELAEQIVRRLLPPGDEAITSEDIQALCRQYPTNLREVLFGLYDLYQLRRT